MDPNLYVHHYPKGVDYIEHPDTDVIPERWDWREHITLSAPRRQGKCGGCWAIASCTMLSDRYRLMGAGRVSISYEYVRSCGAKRYGDGEIGQCEVGGLNEIAVQLLCTEGAPSTSCVSRAVTCPSSLPQTRDCYRFYYGRNPRTVSRLGNVGFDRHTDAATIAHNVRNMQREIMLYGPIAVSYMCYKDMLAKDFSDRSYPDGVYRSDPASGEDTGHAVVIVGWGTSGSTPYWLIRNSWGSRWNGDGHWKMVRGANDGSIEMTSVAVDPDFSRTRYGLASNSVSTPVSTSKRALLVSVVVVGGLALAVLILLTVLWKRRRAIRPLN